MIWSKDRNIIFILIAVQLAICLPFLGSFPIDLDEPFAIFQSQKDLNELIPELLEGNNPPFYFVVLHFWIKIFGLSAFALRGLSLLFAVLTVIPLFKLSKRLLTKEYAILVVLFFIFSTFNHYHAMEVRMYSLMVMLTVLCVSELHKIIFEKGSGWLLLAIWNVLLLYTHYLSPLIIGVELLLILIFIKSAGKRTVLQLFLSFGVVLLLYLPALLASLKKVENFASAGTWVPVPKITELYGNIIRFMNYNISFFIIIGLIVLFGVIYRQNLKERLVNALKDRKIVFVFLFFCFTYLGMFVFSLLVQPVFLDRYLLFTTPFLYLTIVVVIKVVNSNKNSFLMGLFVIPMIASCYYIPKTNRDGDEMAKYVRDKISDNGEILICPPTYDLTFIYHYNQEIFQEYNGFEERLNENGIQKVYSYEDIKLKKNTDQLIFVNANSVFLYPNNNVLSGMVDNFTFIEEKNFLGSYSIHIFEPK